MRFGTDTPALGTSCSVHYKLLFLRKIIIINQKQKMEGIVKYSNEENRLVSACSASDSSFLSVVLLFPLLDSISE